MRTTTQILPTLCALLALSPGIAAALDLTAGFSRDPVDPLQLGSDFIINQAQTGGGDAQVADGVFGWAAQYTDMWDVGTAVSLTGVAVPIQVPFTETGDWTFTFFELDGGPNANAFDGYDFGTMSGETVLGSVTATYTDADVTDEYYIDFDTPINFTAASTGLAFHMQSTAAARVKTRPAGLVNSRGVRVSLADGAPIGGVNPNFRATLAGTPVAFDPPPPPSLEHRFVASLDPLGDNVWTTEPPSQERFVFESDPAGDYNGDGARNAADYTVWRNNLGADAATALAAGSRDPSATDPNVNQDDYTFWRNNYGGGPPTPVDVNDSAVPGITKAYDVGGTGQAGLYETQINGQQASRQDGSFEVWFKPDDLAGGDQIIFEVGGTGTGSYLSLQDNTLSFYINGQFDGNEQTVTTTLADADWTQVAVVIHNTFSPDVLSDDDFVDLYVDGTLVESTSGATTDINRWAGGNQAGLGQEGGNFAAGGPITAADVAGQVDFPFAGQIAIYEYAATAWDAQEVLTRFNAITTPQNAASTALVPEPSALMMAAVFAMMIGGARRRVC